MSLAARRDDDEDILDTDLLWRALLPEWIVPAAHEGVRVSSAAFLDRRTGEVSVDVAKRTTLEVARSLKTFPELAELRAETPRTNRHLVATAPEANNEAHALICPKPPHPRTTKGNARAMADASRILD